MTTSIATKEHLRALDMAKIGLMQKPDSVFFMSVCFSLKHIFTEDVARAATDGSAILLNPDYFLSIDKDERIFVMLHETMHPAYMHFLRQMGRIHDKWNMAADYVINAQLVERGFKMPANCLYDPAYSGMSVEQVYDLLPDDIECPGDLKDLLPPKDGDVNKAEEFMRDVLVRAAIQSKKEGDRPGTIPGEIKIYLDRLLDPKLPWQQILSRYFKSFTKNDYSFKKPNRRFFPQHYLPSLYSKSLMNIAVAVDVSGSVSDNDFLRIISETGSIIRMLKPEKLTFIQFDHGIKMVDDIKTLKDLKGLNFSGRGGTDIEPVLNWANVNKPQILLIFTDGKFYFQEDCSVKSEVIWMIHDNDRFKAPFGKTIHYEINQA